MCNDTETRHTLFEPIKPIYPTQDPGFRYVSLDPEINKTPFVGGDTIRFKLPQRGILYPESMELFFNLRGNLLSNFGRFWAFNNDIRTIFSSCRVLLGRSVVIEDTQEFGVLSQLFYTNNDEAMLSTMNAGYLRGIANERATADLTSGATDRLSYHQAIGTNTLLQASVPRRYMIRLEKGFFGRTQKPIPLDHFQEELILEFRLQSDIFSCGYIVSAPSEAAALTLDGRNAVEVGRALLRFKVENSHPALTNMISQAIAAGQLRYQWEGFYHQRTPLNILTRTQRIEVPCFRKRIKYALAIIRCETDLTSPYQDATQKYASLDPRVRTDVAVARNTALRQYQWRYNNRLFPETPVDVCHTRLNENGSTVATSYDYDTTTNMTSSGAMAYYYLNEVLAPGKQLIGSMSRDNPWMIMDGNIATVSATGTITTKISGATGGFQTYPCGFIMAGKFGYTSVDGNTRYALDGTQLNTKLELQLDFQDSALSSPVGAPNMYVDVWVAFDNVLTLMPSGEHRLDQ